MRWWVTNDDGQSCLPPASGGARFPALVTMVSTRSASKMAGIAGGAQAAPVSVSGAAHGIGNTGNALAGFSHRASYIGVLSS